jgi:hypothetical protein
MATALYIYTTSDYRALTNSEMATVRSRLDPPLMVKEDGEMRNLSVSQWTALNWEVETVFGPTWNHAAVAHIEELSQILYWTDLRRCWRKIGGDHLAGRPPLDGITDVSQRVVRIMWTYASIEGYVKPDNSDLCTQTWQGKLEEWTDP